LKILVAIPAYNEETSIWSDVLRSKKYADKVVVVDDGSTDKGG
jgi:glycosyltransferase involved in cell wall biosynthesis